MMPPSLPETSIVVHGGRAHADDFLAACVCHYRLGLPVMRAGFTEEMLRGPEFWVLDQGRRFEPELHNFDHHQLELEICSFTMVLDHFYGGEYRKRMPSLRFLEIFDSYGPSRAAAFAGTTQESLEITTSPVHTALIGAFSREEGLVGGAMIEIMLSMGREICKQIEDLDSLFKAISIGHGLLDICGLEVLDVTRCVPPPGHRHDQLPTKLWCKSEGLSPVVVLTKDTRTEGAYRMVSINTESARFLPNPKSHFTHASGFLTSFMNYGDHVEILERYTARGHRP
jgi:hypothetical protein